ncbi:sigma factor-like helix-turn-helix DNA-binding protein [Orenia marismortui]
MDYSEIEIGKSLNVSRQAVNRAKNRALNKIRKYLAS